MHKLPRQQWLRSNLISSRSSVADDAEITLSDRVLTIRGERKVAETGYSYSERTYGKFKRHITLSTPVVADSVSAGLDSPYQR